MTKRSQTPTATDGEREGLAFAYQHEKASGEPSTFFRLVDRDEE